MKSKLSFLTKMSLKKKIGTKWFLLANIALAIIIIGIVNIDSIIQSFGGDFNKKTEILVIDNSNVYEDFKINYEATATYLEDITNTKLVKYNKTANEAQEEIKKDGKMLLIIENDETNFLKAELITKDNINALVYQVIVSSLSNVKKNIALEHYNISHDLLTQIDSPVSITRTRLNEEKTTNEMMELVMSVVFPIIILPFFVLTMFLVQMIGAEINEEKTTKGMEIIISNVSPKTHFFSKMLAANGFVIIQALLLLFYVGIGLIIRLMTTGSLLTGDAGSYVDQVVTGLTESGVLNSLVYIIPIMLVLMILTFIAYSLVAGILASMTTNMEDYQQVQTPIIIVSLIGYYLAIMAAMFEGSIFIKVASYVPFISALLGPALLFLGQITIFDICISTTIMILLIWFLFKYGLKIYKIGILNYSSTNLWKKIFKAAKS